MRVHIYNRDFSTTTGSVVAPDIVQRMDYSSSHGGELRVRPMDRSLPGSQDGVGTPGGRPRRLACGLDHGGAPSDLRQPDQR